MKESILESIKKLLGGAEGDDHFDCDLIIHINSVFAILTQLGVGPEEGFSIEDDTATWSDFIGADQQKLMPLRTYMYLKVKLLFDPPSSAAAIASMERLISEFESRLNYAADNK